MPTSGPFRSLLVPYDGSEPARGALALALVLARAGARLTVVTVVDESAVMTQSETTVTSYDPTPLFEALDQQGRALLRDAAARCAAAGVTAATEIVHDTPVAGIIATCTASACDLIVMGTHARTGLAHTFLGSTTDGVLRSSLVPVLTTRAGESGSTPFGTALVAIDDSDVSVGALEIAAELGGALGTKLIAVHATDTTRLYENAATYGFDPTPLADDAERENAAIVAHALERAAIASDAIDVALVDGPPVRVILQTAEERRATVIVVGSHGRRGLDRLFLGSVAEAVVRHSPLPVLVVRRRPDG